jgi:hypothetical protein
VRFAIIKSTAFSGEIHLGFVHESYMGEQSAVQHAPGEQLLSDRERPEVGMSFQQHTVLTTA